jgi:hypothetical protein
MEDSIKDFIIDDVLSQYTFLFSQLQENTSPNGTYPLAYVCAYIHTHFPSCVRTCLDKIYVYQLFSIMPPYSPLQNLIETLSSLPLTLILPFTLTLTLSLTCPVLSWYSCLPLTIPPLPHLPA